MYKSLRIHKHEKIIKERQIDHKLDVYSNKKKYRHIEEKKPRAKPEGNCFNPKGLLENDNDYKRKY